MTFPSFHFCANLVDVLAQTDSHCDIKFFFQKDYRKELRANE